MSAVRLIHKIDYSFVFLIMFCLVINIPYLDPEFMIGHDTKNSFIAFHYFFNHLSWHGELPRWMPYSGYGYSSVWYQIVNFSPNTYLLGLIGWLLKIRDTMMLFKLAAVADQLVFVLGLHLLSTRLYKCRYTRFVVCIAGIGSVVWYWQIYFDLRLFYLIPLVLYLYHRFLVSRQPWAFWGAFFVMLMNMLGAIPYWAPVYLFLFLVMNAVLLPEYWRSLSSLSRPGWNGLCLMIAFIAGLVALSYIYATCMDGLHNYSSGRTPENLDTDLKTFLTYSPPLWGILHAFFDGIRPDPTFNTIRPDDLRIYVGLLAIAALPVAIFTVRNRWFYTLLAVMAAILLLAGGGITSLLLYWVFPGMDKYRHLSLLLELGKIILLLAAGYGMEILFKKLSDTGWLREHCRLPILLMLLFLLTFILDMIVADNVHDNIWVSSMVIEHLLPKGGEWVVARLCAWALFLIIAFLLAQHGDKIAQRYSKALLPKILLLVCVLDMYSFQMNRWSVSPPSSKIIKPAFEKLHFYDARSNSAFFPQSATQLMTHYGDSVESFFFNVIQESYCIPWGRVDLFSNGVNNLMTARGLPMYLAYSDFSKITMNDQALNRIMGCESSKLRIVPQALFVENDSEFHSRIRGNPVLDSMVLLRGAPPAGLPGGFGVEPNPADYVVEDFNANRLDIEIDVKPGQSGWLVYADSYNPHWKATVNNIEAPVYEAYMAFKAVYVKEGRNRVVFEFKNVKQLFAMNFLMILGIVFSAACMCGIIRCLWKREHI